LFPGFGNFRQFWNAEFSWVSSRIRGSSLGRASMPIQVNSSFLFSSIIWETLNNSPIISNSVYSSDNRVSANLATNGYMLLKYTNKKQWVLNSHGKVRRPDSCATLQHHGFNLAFLGLSVRSMLISVYEAL